MPATRGAYAGFDIFGQLIGNTDRHFGNLSFYVEDTGTLRLAPAYDMLPMVFAPQGTNLVERQFQPLPPTADTFEVWPDVVRCAVEYWDRLAGSSELSRNFRKLCRRCKKAVEATASSRSGLRSRRPERDCSLTSPYPAGTLPLGSWCLSPRRLSREDRS